MAKHLKTSDGVHRQAPKQEHFLGVECAERPNHTQIKKLYMDCEGSLFWLYSHGGISWPYTLLLGVSEDEDLNVTMSRKLEKK